LSFPRVGDLDLETGNGLEEAIRPVACRCPDAAICGVESDEEIRSYPHYVVNDRPTISFGCKY
jgi:hypothetical protein